MKDIDQYIDHSYSLYLDTTTKYVVAPVDKKEYRELIFSAGYALKECHYSKDTGHPYVIVKVGDLYMKAVKVDEQLRVSFLDREAFNVLTTYKKETT